MAQTSCPSGALQRQEQDASDPDPPRVQALHQIRTQTEVGFASSTIGSSAGRHGIEGGSDVVRPKSFLEQMLRRNAAVFIDPTAESIIGSVISVPLEILPIDPHTRRPDEAIRPRLFGGLYGNFPDLGVQSQFVEYLTHECHRRFVIGACCGIENSNDRSNHIFFAPSMEFAARTTLHGVPLNTGIPEK